LRLWRKHGGVFAWRSGIGNKGIFLLEPEAALPLKQLSLVSPFRRFLKTATHKYYLNTLTDFNGLPCGMLNEIKEEGNEPRRI